MTIAMLLHGVGTGLIGIFIALLIRQIQVWGFGDAEGGFLEIAILASPWRRICAVVSGGIFGALSWYWLRGCDPATVSVEASLKGQWMPPLVTVLNGMIQDIVVALGGSFGREAAPREIAAMWGGCLARLFAVTGEERTVLVACGTGAGLAAVYSVPISGFLYTLEHVLKWDMSFGTVIPAAVTSALATCVAGLVVDDAGLYAMPQYSYEWPSFAMIFWAVGMGPVAAGSAVGFRRVVKIMEALKPQGRVAVTFLEACQGDRLWLHQGKGEHEWIRRQATVTARSREKIWVRYDGEFLDDAIAREDWEKSHPEGRRDWKILVAMPTVSLLLGILSHDFPTLLGNGRALAEVAIKRVHTPGFFAMLLFLKAGMTSAAIGAGAAGGILTPSVALGATLGAVCGEGYQQLCPSLAPGHDEPMSVVVAAAFLSVTMNSPITSIWLLMEFAAQGIDRADLMLLLQGDASGLVRSKLAAGMLVPICICVLSANMSLRGGTLIADKVNALLLPNKRKASKQATLLSRKSSYAFDFGVQEQTTEEADEPLLNQRNKAACWRCFQAGLIMNTCVTIGVAAAVPACHGADTEVSAAGVALAAVCGLLVWSWSTCREKGAFGSEVIPWPLEEEEEAVPLTPSGWKAGQGAPPLIIDEDNDIMKAAHARSPTAMSDSDTKTCRGEALGACCGVLCSVTGAAAPLAPWVLHIWQDEGGGFTALAVSAATAVAAAAFGAYGLALENQPDAESLATVVHQILIVVLAAIGAGAVGFIWGRSGIGSPEIFSMVACGKGSDAD